MEKSRSAITFKYLENYRAFRGADPDKRAMLRSRGLWDEPEPEPEPDDEGEAPLQPEVRQE